MLTLDIEGGRPRGRPLTHRECIAVGNRVVAQHGKDARPWVQVRKHHKEGPYVLCGRVVELGGNGAEWFQVDTCIGPMWVEGQNVRLCSGDGRCSCEPATDWGQAPC